MIRLSKSGERGGSKMNFILTILILVAMITAAVKIVPAYFAKFQIQDAIETESKFALTGFPKKNMDDIRDDVFKKAQDLDIPVQRDAIRVVVNNGSVEIGLDYSVPVDLYVYKFSLDFHPHADNHTL